MRELYLSYINWWFDHPTVWAIAAIVGAAIWVGGTIIQYKFRRH